jgi:hypothetical protein
MTYMEIMLRVVLWVGVPIVIGNVVLMVWLLRRYRHERRQRSADHGSVPPGLCASGYIVWPEPRLHDQAL